MDSKNRLTAQGIRDLNYYGPRRVPVVAVAPEGLPATEPAVEPTVPVAQPTVPDAVAVAAD